jgi:hypothetical protein
VLAVPAAECCCSTRPRSFNQHTSCSRRCPPAALVNVKDEQVLRQRHAHFYPLPCKANFETLSDPSGGRLLGEWHWRP